MHDEHSPELERRERENEILSTCLQAAGGENQQLRRPGVCRAGDRLSLCSVTERIAEGFAGVLGRRAELLFDAQ